MKIRQALAALAAGAAMLTLGLAQPAGAATPYVIQALGRSAPTYTSYPTDPTPTSKWVASAQGEVIDKEGVGKIEPNALRGRAAVLETFGVRRVRIYDVQLQRLVNGAWQPVAREARDVVSEASRAYAVSYTPPTRPLCWIDESLRRTYRVVNSHGVRRDDGIVANRTTVSKSFSTYALDDDPACPRGILDANLGGLGSQLAQGQPEAVQVHFDYFTTLGVTAQNVVARVNFSDGIEVKDVPEGMALDLSTPDPNDYVRGSARRATAGASTRCGASPAAS